MPTTEPSCRASTNRRSSGRPVRKLISVDPGLAKIVVMPKRRKTSKVASRTVVMMTVPSVSGVEPAGFFLGERQRLVRGRVAVHHGDGHGADRGDDGEDVEAPRVGQACGEQPSADERAGDRAETPDAARGAH